MTFHENLWTLKFDKFSEFQNVISDNPPPPPPPAPQTSLSRIAYGDRYVTHPLPIFNSYLFNRIKIVPIFAHESPKPISLIKRRIENLTKALLPWFSEIIIIIFQVSVGKSFTEIWEWLYSRNWVFLISKYWQDRACSSSLMHVIIACNHLQFFKIFSNFEQFSATYQIFCVFSESHTHALTF